MSATTRIMQAAWIAPMDAPLIRDGAVATLNGQIVAVGPAKKIRSEYPDAEINDLGSSILLPGLVNAHTHLELSDRTCGHTVHGTFADWVLGLRGGSQSPEQATQLGIEQCLRFGTTTVGDITQHPDMTRRVIGRSPLRCVSYGEVLGLAKRRARFDELLARAIDEGAPTPKLRIGLSPHAPYTVDLDGYKQTLALAKERGLPLATHLAENVAETDFLKSHSGMFRQLWETIGSWEEPVPTYPGSPIEMASGIGMLDYSTLLAHVNYCDDRELDLLSFGRASVVYCPRTHEFFGHPPHRWRDMLARGINVAIGTDSCASSFDLNLLEDLRLVREFAPDVPAQAIWQMATIRAARAIQMEGQIGSITPGKRADFASFYATGNPKPLEDVLQGMWPPKSIWIDGVPIVNPASPASPDS